MKCVYCKCKNTMDEFDRHPNPETARTAIQAFLPVVKIVQAVHAKVTDIPNFAAAVDSLRSCEVHSASEGLDAFSACFVPKHRELVNLLKAKRSEA